MIIVFWTGLIVLKHTLSGDALSALGVKLDVKSTLPPFEDFFFLKPNFFLSFLTFGEKPSGLG